MYVHRHFISVLAITGNFEQLTGCLKWHWVLASMHDDMLSMYGTTVALRPALHLVAALCHCALQAEADLAEAWSHADPGLTLTSSCPAFSD